MIDFSASSAALLFLLSDFIFVFAVRKFINRPHSNFGSLLQLDPEYLVDEWKFRIDNHKLEVVAHFFVTAAWVALVAPLLQLAWINSRGGKVLPGVNVSIGILAVCAALIELVSNLIYVGMSGAATWIAEDFNLDDWGVTSSNVQGGDMIGWRALEVSFMISRGVLNWIDAMEYALMACIFVLVYLSNRASSANFKRSWAQMGLIIGMFCILAFVSSVMRLESWSFFTRVGILLSVSVRLILLPSWLLWLSCQLPHVMREFEMSNVANGTGAFSDDRQLELQERYEGDGNGDNINNQASAIS